MQAPSLDPSTNSEKGAEIPDISSITIDEVSAYISRLSADLLENTDIKTVFLITAEGTSYSVHLENVDEQYLSIVVGTFGSERDSTPTQVYLSPRLPLPQISVDAARDALATVWGDSTELDIISSVEIFESRHPKPTCLIKMVLEPLRQRVANIIGMSIDDVVKSAFDIHLAEKYQELQGYLLAKSGEVDFGGTYFDPEMTCLAGNHACVVKDLKGIIEYVESVA